MHRKQNHTGHAAFVHDAKIDNNGSNGIDSDHGGPATIDIGEATHHETGSGSAAA